MPLPERRKTGREEGARCKFARRDFVRVIETALGLQRLAMYDIFDRCLQMNSPSLSRRYGPIIAVAARASSPVYLPPPTLYRKSNLCTQSNETAGLYISRIGLPIGLQQNRQILGI